MIEDLLNKFLKRNSGFTLIEVVASIIIVSIVLLSFSQIFIQANRTATYNNEKLVLINLADAALVKLKSQTFNQDPAISNLNDYFKTVTKEIKLNDKSYQISYQASQNINKALNASYSEKDLNLIKVIVTVKSPTGKMSSSTEGYVTLE